MQLHYNAISVQYTLYYTLATIILEYTTLYTILSVYTTLYTILLVYTIHYYISIHYSTTNLLLDVETVVGYILENCNKLSKFHKQILNLFAQSFTLHSSNFNLLKSIKFDRCFD